jgi:hypothetical protein
MELQDGKQHCTKICNNKQAHWKIESHARQLIFVRRWNILPCNAENLATWVGCHGRILLQIEIKGAMDQEGDARAIFFHANDTVRCHKNHIHHVIMDENLYTEQADKMCIMADFLRGWLVIKLQGRIVWAFAIGIEAMYLTSSTNHLLVTRCERY